MTTCWISDRQGKGDQRQSIGNGTRFQQAVCSTSSSSSAVAHAAGTADQTCRHHRQHSSDELQIAAPDVSPTRPAALAPDVSQDPATKKDSARR